jgi:putative hemolysin
MKYFVAVVLVVAALVLAACAPVQAPQPTPAQGQAGLPNPASGYCVDKGGKLEIRNEKGGQAGYCVFSDGSECDEWAYFRGQCAPGGSYQPLGTADCTEVADAVGKTLGVSVATGPAAFEDYVGGEKGTGCQATATGTGKDYASVPTVAGSLKEMLAARGWEQDMSDHADGPTGTAAGFHKGNRLCLLRVGWEPAPDANCPTDQPISACELTPEQQRYTIVLNCAQARAREAG